MAVAREDLDKVLNYCRISLNYVKLFLKRLFVLQAKVLVTSELWNCCLFVQDILSMR